MGVVTTDSLWAGIDLGTQSIRVVIADDRGTPVASGAVPLASHRANGPTREHIQDPASWWRAVSAASRQAFADLPDQLSADAVGGLAICSTSGTVLLTDESGHALTAAMMYDDARAVTDLQRISAATSASQSSSGGVQLSWALPKIAWLLRHGHGWSSTRGPYVAHSADFIAACLAGHRVDTDSSHALKSGYDVVHERWNGDLLEAAGIEEDLLPGVVRPGTVLGHVTSVAAEVTGFASGTPIVAGMSDGCASQIAAGALTRGTWNSVLGTTLVLKGVSDELIIDPGGAVYNHRHPDRGWLPGGASNVGARVLQEDFAGSDLDALSSAARSYEPAPGVIYPLTATGERFPFVRADATRFEVGAIRGDGARFAALLQGVAFVERLCFEHLTSLGADIGGEIVITGGGARSDYWNQLRADVLGRALVVAANTEAAFGMAVLASASADRTSVNVTERARAMVSPGQAVEPRPGMHERFTETYALLVDELVRRGYLGSTR